MADAIILENEKVISKITFEVPDSNLKITVEELTIAKENTLIMEFIVKNMSEETIKLLKRKTMLAIDLSILTKCEVNEVVLWEK